MPVRTSMLAWRTTSITGCGCANKRFCFRRRKVFSTSTTASSTSSPMAMAMPPSVITLMVCPSQ